MKTKTLLRDCALAVPLLLLVGSLIGGSWGALAVGVSGLVALGNLALLALVVERLLQALAEGTGAGVAMALLMGKMVLLFTVYALLLVIFPALYVALGLAIVMGGLTVSGLLGGLRASNPVEEA